MVIVGPHWKCPHCGERYIPAVEQKQPANPIAATMGEDPARLSHPIPRHKYWPALHLLAEASDDQGLTGDERINAIVNRLLDLPPTVRRQLLADVLRLSRELPDLHAAATAAVNLAEKPAASKLLLGEVG